MERATVHGVHTSLASVKITVTGGATAAIFRVVADQGVVPGLVSGRAAIAFTVARSAGPVVLAALRAARARIGFHRVDLDVRVAVITVTGVGLRTDPVIPATFCEVLTREGVRLELVSFESRRISVACGRHQREVAVRALCEVFEVGATPTTSDGHLPVVT